MGKPVAVQDLFQGALKVNKKTKEVWSTCTFPKWPLYLYDNPKD